MRLAWFRPSTRARDALSDVEGRAVPLTDASGVDATALLIAQLRATHDLDVYTRANAHDFVPKHFRVPYALCVFELDNTAAHAFIWPYLLHYPGVLLLASPTLHDSRAVALVRAGRRDDYAAEFRFTEGHAPPPPPRTGAEVREGPWPMLRIPLTATRMTVVAYPGLATRLRDYHPYARIAHAPLPTPPVNGLPPRRVNADGTVTFGILAGDRVDAARRALARAQALGGEVALAADASIGRVLHDADVILVLAWPPGGEPQRLAHAALAAGTPLITLDTIVAADWPSLDPQTWRPRGGSRERPIAVTVDLRDEEHSLAVALRRLSADAALRSELGDAARVWSRAHESLPVASAAWARILDEAARLHPPPRPPDWPAHLTADGTERARAMLAEFGVSVDLF